MENMKIVLEVSPTKAIVRKKIYDWITLGTAGYLDRIILGSSHMYNSPTCKEVYKTQVPFDPEGKKKIT